MRIQNRYISKLSMKMFSYTAMMSECIYRKILKNVNMEIFVLVIFACISIRRKKKMQIRIMLKMMIGSIETFVKVLLYLL